MSSVTPWMRSRDEWVRELSVPDLLRVIAKVLELSKFDDTGGDVMERSETLQWLATRGAEGKEWGQAGAAAEDLGLWSEKVE